MKVWIDKFQMIAWETETKLDRVKRFLVSGVYTKTTYYLFDRVCYEKMIAWKTETKLDRVKRFLVSGVYTKTTYYLPDGVCYENLFGLWMVLE